jgi:8-oxo-dGTP diphosphatase
MSAEIIRCPSCGAEIKQRLSPLPTVDMIIYDPRGRIVLVRRRYPPPGWALPGGFVDYGESVEEAARREALEESSLEVSIKGLLGVYSDPARDIRRHTISTVFWGTAENAEKIKAGDDAGEAVFFPLDALPSPLAFDHARIINDFAALLRRRSRAGKF